MNTASLSLALQRSKTPWYARRILTLLQEIEHGSLEVQLPDGLRVQVGHGVPLGHLRFARWSAFHDILSRGDIGFAEGYIEGAWDTPDLTGLLTLLASNRSAIDQAIYGRWWGRLYSRLRHLLNANTLSGAKRNIATHYDLGNDFYSRWLDPSMTYSSARFDGDFSQSLEAAQVSKYQHILDLLDLPAAQSLLEIGCGWGGFAEHAAKTCSHTVRGITLSREQLDYARARIRQAGLAEQCHFAYQDYREEERQYDGIVSIEMFEAVGEAYWPVYFATLKKTLKPGGRAVVQTILIDDALFERYRNGSDFIQQYIFPGGMLPSSRRFIEAAAAAGLTVTAQENFGPDYAETLRRWHQAFIAQIEAVRHLGFDERFIRIWRFYLAYCEAGFTAGSIDVAQFRLEHTV
ncbi:MAG: SAM-dependent methyltransferase [Hydrogenophilales bacterium 16-64-46]|nr:MAG: SAM-dependent methyltransferase [Hydrogenophilales bacterium 12-64-13]OYZ04157.1 MAG: SAM-dependent methyltransferase [Hydrogenophilales bacterium 16-64-46]OZA36926.1 MAG: SAM-dependent methyltransferase [Hydrogenophilales bacterium 17-64-34]HQS99952.1 cyclopropane-fatty-acyl-phospholipid synthase family protein [Thiobacillus sp.]